MNLRETVSGWALHTLNQDRVDQLRGLYFALRGKLNPLMCLVYGTYNVEDLRQHLEQKIGKDFDILMVHSSVNHMQPMFQGSPLELVKMLMEYCGPDKTLVMPAFYFGDPNIGGVHATFQHRPKFDLKRTPSQMGLATELFRRTPGVCQSRHPIYRLSAYGPLAQALTAGHEHCVDPAGPGSPFEFMDKHNTLIIGIGKPFQVLTHVHHAEGMLGDEFPAPRHSGQPLALTVVDGKEEFQATLSGKGLKGTVDVWKLRKLMSKESLREWTFHNTPLFAVRAHEVTVALMDAAKKGITLYN